MALTLIEASKIALGKDEVFKAGIMELYASNSDLIQYMPWETISGNAYHFQREKVLPTVEFRGVNEGYTESTGEVENITEHLCIAGGDIDVDQFLVDTSGPSQRETQEGMKIKALSLKLTKNVIKGDVTSDPKSFDGFQIRTTGDQLINAGSTASGDALSLTKLDEAIDAVENPTHILMNKTMRRRLTAAARNTSVGGYITYTMDAFGRKITMYNDIPILIAFKDETNAEIMPFTEAAPGGGSNVCTSLYILSMTDNGVVGLQSSEMQVRDLGEIDTKPVYRTRIEWYVTISIQRPRAISRLRGIKDAAVTA
jgi:hypothetical protein